MAYAVNATAVSSVTVTISSAKQFAYNVVEFNGIDSASPVDQSASASNAAGTSQTTPSLTTTSANDLIIGGVSASGGVFSLSTAGATALTDRSSSVVGAGAYQVVSSTGTYSISWNNTLSRSAGIGIMAFKAAGSGGAETPTLDKLMRHGKWFNSSGVHQPFTF
jgi:hypothetical protein